MSDPLDTAFFDAAPPQARGPRPLLRFFSEPVELPGKSAEEGRPVFVARDFVGITNPGSRDEVIRRAEDKAKEDEFVAWAYAKWKKTQQQPTDGTPIETIPFISKAMALELKAINIHSLETLATAPETAIQRMMGLRDLKKKAQAFMEAAKDTALVTKLQGELSARDRQIEMMQKQMAEMSARFDAMAAKQGAAA